jgi:hypothetical protein
LRADFEAEAIMETHFHVSVFHGPREEFAPGLELHATQAGWEVRDELGQIGARGASYGTFATDAEACREALRLLRARHGAPVRPVWDAGAPNEALAELGYSRGRAKWRWWPPGFVLLGASQVGPNGAPQPR